MLGGCREEIINSCDIRILIISCKAPSSHEDSSYFTITLGVLYVEIRGGIYKYMANDVTLILSLICVALFYITTLMDTLCGKLSMFNHLQIYSITTTIHSGASASSRVHSGLCLVIVGNTDKRSVTSEPLSIKLTCCSAGIRIRMYLSFIKLR